MWVLASETCHMIVIRCSFVSRGGGGCGVVCFGVGGGVSG